MAVYLLCRQDSVSDRRRCSRQNSRQLQALGAVGGDAQLVVGALEMKLNEHRDVRVILENKHPRGTHAFSLA